MITPSGPLAGSPALFLALVLASAPAGAVPADCPFELAWTAEHDGASHSWDYAMYAAVDRRGDVVVAGGDRVEPSGAWTGILRRYTPAGKTRWEVRLEGIDIAAVGTWPSGDVAIAGFGEPPAPGWIVARYSAGGRLVWKRTSGDDGKWRGNPYSLAVDPAGRLVVGGWRRKTGIREAEWLIQSWSPDGSLRWERADRSEWSADSVIKSVAVGKDGGVVAGGFEYRIDPDQNRDWAIRAYTAEGKPKWEFFHDGPAHSYDAVNGVAVDSDGSVVAVGEESAPAVAGAISGEHPVMRRLDAGGNVVWERDIGTTGRLFESAAAVALDGGGRIIVCGVSWSRSPGGTYEWLVVACDRDGRITCRLPYASRAALGDAALSVAAGPGGVFAVAGYEDRSDLGRATDWRLNVYRMRPGER